MSCALECEKLGVTADVFERHHSVGWIWLSVSTWINVFDRRYDKDIVKCLQDTYDINIKFAMEEKTYIMKSPNAEIRIEGNLGLTMYRGKEVDSTENQLARELRKTSIYYNKLINLLKTPGIKQLVYNTHIDFADMIGSILKKLQ